MSEPVEAAHAQPDPTALLPESGDLADRSVARLLLELGHARFSGALELQRQKAEKRFGFHQGFPVLAESNLTAESLAAHLHGRDALCDADRERVAEVVTRKRCKEGAALLALGLLEARALFDELRAQLRRMLLDCIAWPDGCYRLDRTFAVPDDAKPFRIDPVPLAREGLAQHWSMERLGAALTPRLGSYPAPRRRFARAARRLGDDAAALALCSKLDGRHTLAQALGAGAASPDVLACAWILDAGDCLEYRDAPLVDDSDGAAALEIEVEITEAPASGGASAEKREARRKREPRAAASDNAAEVEAMRKEVLEQHEQLGVFDHYALLGVERDASAAQIKKSYFKAAKRYHPDALSRLGLDDVKGLAGEVFARIGEAYNVLSNDDKRANYDAQLDGGLGDEADLSRLAQAETFYRKGEILVKMGDFRGALEFLDPAVELWPDEPAYQLALGWALYKKAPPELERALEHLERAVAMNPDDAITNFRLGTVMRANGDEDRAAPYLAAARKLDPSLR